MKDPTLLVTLALLVVVTGAAGVLFTGIVDSPDPQVRIQSVVTDRETYRSSEQMQIEATISAQEAADGLILHVEGITDRYGKNRLLYEEPLALLPGEQIVSVNYTLPVCSKCAGLDPGAYAFDVTIRRERTIIANASHAIQLE